MREAGSFPDAPPPPPASAGYRQIAPTSLAYPGQTFWKAFLRLALPLAAAIGFSASMQPDLGWLLLLPGGILWMAFFCRRRTLCLLTSWMGAKLGMLLGLLSYAFFALFFAAESAANVPAYRQTMEKLGQDLLTRYPTPESRQMAQAWFSGPHGVAVITAMFLTSALLSVLLIGGITGAFAGVLARGRNGR